jgi:hypothetical protein
MAQTEIQVNPNLTKYKAANGDIPQEVLPSGVLVWARNAKGEPVCNSPKGHVGGRCKISVGLFPNGRCERHGGKAPKGPDHWAWKNGEGSKYADVLGEKAREDYLRLMADPDYLELRDDIALSRQQLREALIEFSQVDVRAVTKLFKAADNAEGLIAGEYDEGELEEELKGLIGLIRAVEEGVRGRKELRDQQEHVRKLVDTENKRIMQEVEQIPANRAIVLFQALRDSVRTHVWKHINWLNATFPEVTKHDGYENPLGGVSRDIERLMPRKTLAEEAGEEGREAL